MRDFDDLNLQNVLDLILMSRINYMLSRVEHKNKFNDLVP